MTNEDRLKDLLDIEEKNDIFNLTREERGEFQNWVKKLLERNESADKWYKLLCEKWDEGKVVETINKTAVLPSSAEGEYIKKEDAINAIRKSAHYGRTQKIYVCHREVVDSIDELPTYSFPDRESTKDFPQAEDIKPTIESFKRTMDNIDKLIGDFDSFPDREKGEWIKHPTFHEDFDCWVCNKCGEEISGHENKTNFCPNCGADMRGDKAE